MVYELGMVRIGNINRIKTTGSGDVEILPGNAEIIHLRNNRTRQCNQMSRIAHINNIKATHATTALFEQIR
ncbi:MAG: hypothetical protein BWX80_01942 [Candidatus Hydrogenedentes bacterium ADurb.Bin101]|nr:MAG: hypothetical protein BWX80_01942 [Candidatus Hydrogenedentes bacterium ADurb.Bin101]